MEATGAEDDDMSTGGGPELVHDVVHMRYVNRRFSQESDERFQGRPGEHAEVLDAVGSSLVEERNITPVSCCDLRQGRWSGSEGVKSALDVTSGFIIVRRLHLRTVAQSGPVLHP